MAASLPMSAFRSKEPSGPAASILRPKTKRSRRQIDIDSYLEVFRLIPVCQDMEQEQLTHLIKSLVSRKLIPHSMDEYNYYKILDLLKWGFDPEATPANFEERLLEADPSFIPEALKFQLEEARLKALSHDPSSKLGEVRPYECRRCRTNRFYELELQLRKADEGANVLIKCAKCNQTYGIL